MGADTWEQWAAGAIKHATAVASRQGMVRVGNRLVLRTMDGNSRAKLGHSLGGELQRDSDDFLDGLSVAASRGTPRRPHTRARRLRNPSTPIRGTTSSAEDGPT